MKKKRIRRLVSGWMAAIMALITMVSIMPPITIRATVTTDKSNLLDGVPFDVCGKDRRTVMYHWLEKNGVYSPRSAYCIEPSKEMWLNAALEEKAYGIHDGFPLIDSAEQFQELCLILQWCNNYETGGKVGNSRYIVAQGAIWVVMSNQRIGSAFYMNEMQTLKAHVRNARDKAQFDGLMADLVTYVQKAQSPPLPAGMACSEASAAERPQRMELEDGIWTLHYNITAYPALKDVRWKLPDGDWRFQIRGNELIFQYAGLQEPSGVITAEPLPESLRTLIPRDGKIIVLETDNGIDSNRFLQTMISGFVPSDSALFIQIGINPVSPSGREFQIYRHSETFSSNYRIDLNKYCSETGKPLEGSVFDVFEGFDGSRLGGALEERHMYPEPASWGGMRLCGQMTTDAEGRGEHRDTRYYDYSKTYCTGHPEPELLEPPDDEGEGDESGSVEEENRRRMAQWEAECALCEENTDFHDIDGGGLDMMLADRDQTYAEFISLEYSYTIKEAVARNGYIQHGKHNDDVPVETIITASSEAGGDGRACEPEEKAAAGSFAQANGRGPAGVEQDLKGLVPSWDSAKKTLELPTAMPPADLDEVRTVTGRTPLPVEGETIAQEADGETKSSSDVRDEEREKKDDAHAATPSGGKRPEPVPEASASQASAGLGTSGGDLVRMMSTDAEGGLPEDWRPDRTSDKAEDAAVPFGETRESESQTSENKSENHGNMSKKMTEQADRSEDGIEDLKEDLDEEVLEEEGPEEHAPEDMEEAGDEGADEEVELINDLSLEEPFSYVLHPEPFSPLTFDASADASSDEEMERPSVSVSLPEPVEDDEDSVEPGDPDHLAHTFEVYDHRTEGELHINKRDLELYRADEEGSYGKAQGDATLEGAVYGLYAADDILHPDGKTGVVFKRNELVAIAATEEEGNASFLAITETSATSGKVENLAHTWIGHPLLLGNYYVREIARSEGYELSVTGLGEPDTNRTGSETVLAQNGSVTAGELSHRIDEWDGSWNDFTITSLGTADGYEITVNGYPQGSTFYRVDKKTETVTERVVTGSSQGMKKDALGNVIYKRAVGGEYKVGPDGNYIEIPMASDSQAEDGSGRPCPETFPLGYRLNSYPSGTAAPTVDPSKWADTTRVDADYLKLELNSMLKQLRYKALDDRNGDGAPWINLPLEGGTHAELAASVLDWYASHDFWNSAQVESVFEEEGQWHARLFYDYKGSGAKALYDARHGAVYVRKEMSVEGGAADSHYWLVYSPGEYRLGAYTVTVNEKREIPSDQAVAFGENLEDFVQTVRRPAFETYEPGELLLDREGSPIPETETVYLYETDTHEIETEDLVKLTASYDEEKGIYTIHVPNTTDWTGVTRPVTTVYRAQAPEKVITVDGIVIRYGDYLTQIKGAGVGASTVKKALGNQSYIRPAQLVYPGQNRIYQDAGTREKPVLVMERVIRQAIQVTKDIAQESYDRVNTYEIHKDPFTVLFGGYGRRPGAKTMKGFCFRLYRKRELLDTGLLKPREEASDGAEYDYETFFKEYPDLSKAMAVAWDDPDFDTDHDPTTVCAERGGGVDDYYGTSIPLPYGTYVLVEQQPETIPTKHYRIDKPQEITLPYVPQADLDGTIHQNEKSIEYFYDSQLTPEELTDRYFIRFNEEHDVIHAHNHDGDFKIFKYGLEPDSIQGCGNDRVAGYYHCGSVSEDAGIRDQVYYDIYVDRDGRVQDYGITKNGVKTMTGNTEAVDRIYAPALVPWSVVKPVTGGVVNADGDIGNRLPEAPGGVFNFVGYAHADMENTFYSSRIRIEKLDDDTGENIIHEGALFKIYAAEREIDGVGTGGVTGSGHVKFQPDGTPVYDEKEQVRMEDQEGNEVGIFKAHSTIREVATGDGRVEKRTVGYIETCQPLGAGVYVLVEIQAPAGYVKSRPVAFEVYSDEVTYYEEGDPDRPKTAVRYQYAVPVTGHSDKYETYDVDQIQVRDYPTHIQIHKVEDGDETAGDQNGPGGMDRVNDPGDRVTYLVYGDRSYLEARGDVKNITWDEGREEYVGKVTKAYDEWSEAVIEGTEEELKVMDDVKPLYGLEGTFTGKGIRFKRYVKDAELTLYEGLELKQSWTGDLVGVKAERRFGKVVNVTAFATGTHQEIKPGEKDEGPAHLDVWDAETVKNPPADLYFYDLTEIDTEKEEETGELYVLDDRGNRICLADPETGLAYVYDAYHRIIAYPVDESGRKKQVRSIEVHQGGEGESIYVNQEAVTDENGLPIYYEDGHVTWRDEAWSTPESGCREIARLPVGAYVIEETRVPGDRGYVQAQHMGILLEETDEVQKFFVQDDFTKIAISKVDIYTKQEIRDARLILYDAVRVADESRPGGYHLEPLTDDEGRKRIRASWISGYEYDDGGMPRPDENGGWIPTTAPHWIDHIPVGDYLLEETEVPYEDGYVKSRPMEIRVLETGNVQTFVMCDDYTQVELMKRDADTDRPVPGVRLALYRAELDETGAPAVGEDGLPVAGERLLDWVTGSRDPAVPARIPSMKKACYHLTDEDVLHIDYLPVGHYVMKEEQAPAGYATAAPILIEVKDVGGTVQVQQTVMKNVPLKAVIEKQEDTGKGIVGAVLEIYRAQPDGKRGERIDRWISDGRPHVIPYIGQGDYVLAETAVPYGYLFSREIPFTIRDSSRMQWISMTDPIPKGRIEIRKTAGDSGLPLAGAGFVIDNLTLNKGVETVMTGRDGMGVSSWLPIGGTGLDGVWRPYRYAIREAKAPDGYLLNAEIHEFQFDYLDDRTETYIHHHEARDIPDSKKPHPPSSDDGEDGGNPPVGTPSEPDSEVLGDHHAPVIGIITVSYPSRAAGASRRFLPGKRLPIPSLGYAGNLALAAVFILSTASLVYAVWKGRKKGPRGGTGLFLLLTAVLSLAGPGDVRAEEEPELTITTDVPYGEEEDFFFPDLEYEDEQGDLYKLKSWKVGPVTVEAGEREVELRIVYKDVEGKETIPDKTRAAVQNEVTGEIVTDSIPLVATAAVAERWSDDFRLPVVFHRYDADCYRLREYLIPFGEEKPELKGYEPVLLDMAEISQSDYKILDIRWDGDPYLDEEGTLCRNAVATGRKKVRDYEAVYGGTMILPAYQSYRCTAIYVPQKRDAPVLVRPPEKEITEGGGRIWRILKTIWMITFTAALLIWLIAVVFLWLRNRGKRKKE